MNDTLPLNTEPNTEHIAADKARPIRARTVVWGFILFSIAALCFTWTQFDLNQFEPVVVITWIVLVVGSLAVLGGILGAALHKLRR